MMKNLFLLGLAVAAMTSCTNDEVVEMKQPSQKAIGFESFVNKGTRALAETNSSISKIYAYGYYNSSVEVFKNLTVKKSGNIWEYDLDSETDGIQVAYWTKNLYQFGAYAIGNAADSYSYTSSITQKDPDTGEETTETVVNSNVVTFEESDNTVNLTIPKYKVDDTRDLVADIVTCDNTSLTYTGTVNFSFKNLLTKVKFIVKNNDNKYKMRITSALVINGAYQTGDCKVRKNPNVSFNNQAYPEWTPDENSSVTYNPSFTSLTAGLSAENEYIAINNTVESEDFYVLPQEVENINFSIQATFYEDANQVVAVKDLALKPILVDNNDGKWKEGTYYKYTISLPTSAKPIEFGQIGVGGWTEAPIELNNETDPDA